MARSARSKGVKDKAYLEWIAKFSCVVCTLHRLTQRTFTEVAHVGTRGLSQKCSDRETLPICIWHHRTGPNAHHNLGRRFWDVNGLDRDALIKQFNDRYESERVA